MAWLTGIAAMVCLAAVLSEKTDVTVTSPAGTFTGARDNVEVGGEIVPVTSFLGIPYAEPPVGDLRFRKSVLRRPITDPMTVQTFGPACLQLYFVFPVGDNDSEDCLFLNIFKPEVTSAAGRLPVMVWIHGGGFSLGSSNAYVGDVLAASGPVIVVTLNYRVSLWGFFSTGDSNAPGNYGLWDQHTAFKWVNQNIESFGGDPSRVTIFGQSAGAASVLFQGLYPGNKGLFQRIVSQSGTAASPWAIHSSPGQDATHLASLLDCDTSDPGAMVTCLRGVSAERLNATMNNLSNWEIKVPMAFSAPVVDGDFVQHLPVEVLDKTGTTRPDLRELLASFDLMIGINSGEGVSAVNPSNGVYTDQENFLPNKTVFDQTLVPFLSKMMFGKDVPNRVNEAVAAEYTDWADPENPVSIRQQFVRMHADSFMLGGLYRTCNAHSALSSGRTYQYLYDVVPYKSLMGRPSWTYQAAHGDELQFQFGNRVDLTIPGYTEHRDLQPWETRAAHNIMTIWTNFAATGNPNTPRDLGIDWAPYTPQRRAYMELINEVTASRMRQRLWERRAVLWDESLPSLVRPDQEKNSDGGTSVSSESSKPGLGVSVMSCVVMFSFVSWGLGM